MIKIDRFHKAYESLTVIEELSMTIQEGEFVALLGPSGCGKSTILKAAAGLEVATSGSIYAEHGGRLVDEISYMPQEDALLPWMTAIENIAMPAVVRGIERKVALQQAEQLLQQLALQPFARYYPAQLSGGMKQRIAFLRLFATNRPVWLLDEPFGKLDALTRLELQQWLRTEWERRRQTVLFVTHDIDEAILLATKIIVLSQRPSRIVQQLDIALGDERTIAQLTTQEAMAYKRVILDSLQ